MTDCHVWRVKRKNIQFSILLVCLFCAVCSLLSEFEMREVTFTIQFMHGITFTALCPPLRRDYYLTAIGRVDYTLREMRCLYFLIMILSRFVEFQHTSRHAHANRLIDSTFTIFVFIVILPISATINKLNKIQWTYAHTLRCGYVSAEYNKTYTHDTLL